MVRSILVELLVGVAVVSMVPRCRNEVEAVLVLELRVRMFVAVRL